MDENKNSFVKSISVLSSYVNNVFLTKVTKHLCSLNLNIIFCNKPVNQNWPYSILGNFADIIYQNNESYLHRTGNVCTL